MTLREMTYFKRLNDEFERKLNRSLTMREKEFLRWLAKKRYSETSL
ncbi:hypothetical protein GH741_02450 [Aquibacillus halophilus]|uniref:Uncharacterized protein n=1 Tax=Aquibacillus halophilus TaxID=930132 RepID=A0A6A8D707_9BACI|nr:hypothetical protein [Aquibacillus halophilus]MRH41533.1 hypothetical protein [Aquibacillus halophilus]